MNFLFYFILIKHYVRLSKLTVYISIEYSKQTEKAVMSRLRVAT